MNTMIFWYLATGVLAGMMSGMLGLGGGIVVVPALAAIYLHHHLVPATLYMHMAIGTSLAIMVVTLSSSAYAHHKHGTIDWSTVKTILPGLCIGVLAGSVLIKFLSSKYLTTLFGFFLTIVGVKLLLTKNKNSIGHVATSIAKQTILFFSLLIGMLSSLLGVGGGMLWVPFFLYNRMNMHEAVGTSVACGMAAALTASFLFIVTGLFSTIMIPLSTGFIYWPAFAGVAITSVLFAPIGAAVAYQLSNKWLTRIFAVVLILIAIQMIFFAD